MADGIKPPEYAIEEQTCDGELHEDIAKSILAFVGVNNKRLEECNDENCPFRKRHAIGVEKVFIPKGWKGNAYIKQLKLHTYLSQLTESNYKIVQVTNHF